jgi:MFS family permease
MAAGRDESIESRTSWRLMVVATVIATITFGAPYVTVIALKPIALDLGSPRSVPALAGALMYLGTGVGGIFMGWWADRVGVKVTVTIGCLMVGAGAMLSSLGTEWSLLLGHGVLIGLLGNAGIFAPLMTYITRWFDVRRGVALSFVATGQTMAGALWSPVFDASIERFGWQRTLFWYGVLTIVTVLPLALLLRRPPAPSATSAAEAEARRTGLVLGLAPNMVLALLCAAIVGCCIAMTMPMGHLVAFCSDLGYLPARGAEMLSLLLGCAFIGRFFWGRLSDRIGGLMTILIGSACQAAGLTFFVVVKGLAGLYVISAAFGLGFGGIIPAYVLTVRELFPAGEAGWRIATVLFFGLAAMAFGGWLAGAIYDWAGYYQPAFATGVLFNLVNLVLIGGLIVLRQRAPRLAPKILAAS